MTGQNLEQRLTLVAYLLKHLENRVRKGILNPEAVAVWTVGDRRAAKFGGEVAAKVSMPEPPTRVAKRAELLAWCKKNLPQAIEMAERVRPETERALVALVKEHGGWPDPETGEIVPVDGIETLDVSPRVELDDEAAAVIGRAWRSGEIDLAAVLALPEGGDTDGRQADQAGLPGFADPNSEASPVSAACQRSG